MKHMKSMATLLASVYSASVIAQICPSDPRCIDNPYGAGNPYKANGLMNPYSEYGSQYSNKSWANPYATNAPKIYDQQGNYRGRLSNTPNDPESISNPYGQYGNKYSPQSIKSGVMPHGQPLKVVPQESMNDYGGEYMPITSGNPTVGQVLIGTAVLLGVLVIKAVVAGIIESVNSSKSPIQNNTKTVKSSPSNPDAYIKENNLSGAEANRIGNWYLYSTAEKNPALAYKYLVYAADQGQAQAAFSLATMFRDGNGVQKNPQKSFVYFKQAADNGYLPAKIITADLYYKGVGVEQSHTSAFKYYLQAAEEGDLNAMASVSALYRIGQGTDANPSRARKWATESAAKGNPLGMLQLSMVELTGTDGPQDMNKFFELSQMAAASNQPVILSNLGYAYENGIGTEVNVQTAVTYYQKAADKRVPHAVMALARIDETGSAGKVNKEEALKLYGIASSLGVPGAKTKEMLLKRQMDLSK